MKPSLLNSNNFYHFIINYSSEIGLFAHSEGIYDNLLFYSKQKNKPANILTTSTCNNQISAVHSSETVNSHLPIESSYLPIESSQCLFERFFDRFGNYWGMGLEKYNVNYIKSLKIGGFLWFYKRCK